ncbi:MAG: peroxidase family protein [Pirellulaceae bacterium]
MRTESALPAAAFFARPNWRAISNALLAQPSMMPSSMGLTQMFVTWGQFIDHDMSLTPSQSSNGTDIPVIINATITLDLAAAKHLGYTTDKFGYFNLTRPRWPPSS